MIEVRNVSKKFRIWEDRSRDLKETAINFLKGKRRSFRELWALRDIEVEIKEGETVAFIGENGSGKSTLLKLLCGILFPDEGKIVVKGRISALLELGVGFHPDLTGEENIYLNGAMLGFDREEMRKRFDEVISFSEIGDFIYSPIRTYSSGMAMRLGFSIAMCVDPDILLIDEVLAVGDEAFQEKCFKRLEAFKSAGKTIVIVSHALDLVKKFCERAVLLHKGRLITDGNAEKTIDKYHAMISDRARLPDLERVFAEEQVRCQVAEAIEVVEKKEDKEEREEKKGAEGSEAVAPPIASYQRYGTFEAEIVSLTIRTDESKDTEELNCGDLTSFCLKIRFHRDIEDPVVGISISRYEDGKIIEVYSTNTLWRKMKLGLFKKGTEIEVDFVQRPSLPEGTYYLTVAVANSDVSRFYDWQENLRSFQVKEGSSDWKGTVDLNSQILISR